MRRILAWLLAWPLIAAVTLSAQTVGGVTGGIVYGAPQLSQQRPAAPGTATLRGHVFAADSGEPLRKAQVRIFANEIRESRMATTDANGQYEFTDIRAGRYTVSASKGSYVNVSYGQDRPSDAPKPLEILDRQTIERVDLSLPPGSIVTGRILDEYGEPVPEVQVTAERYQYFQGQRRLLPAGRSVTTDDIGEFRLFGIPPGQYYLSATWRSQNGMVTNGDPGPGGRTAYAPMYFPGTMNANEAQRLTLDPGQQVDDLVMTLKPIKALRITGTAVGADGKALTPAAIMVVQSGGFGFFGTGQVRPDGTFQLSGLAPGEYTVRAQRMGPPGEGPETAAATITVAGEDVSDVRLVAAKPSTLTGRVIVDPAAASSLPIALTISAVPASSGGVSAPLPPPARVAEDYSFEVKSTPGRTRIAIGGGFNSPATGWAVRSVRLKDEDVTDAGIDVTPDEDIRDVEVELTNALTTISGRVTNSRGETTKDYTAIVFAQEKEKWTGNSRYQSTGRPDQDGRFKISGLPPGEYYIVAVDRLEPGQQGDPDFLERVQSTAASLTLNEGEIKTVDLRLSSGL